jgi:hypothetical protein
MRDDGFTAWLVNSPQITITITLEPYDACLVTKRDESSDICLHEKTGNKKNALPTPPASSVRRRADVRRYYYCIQFVRISEQTDVAQRPNQRAPLQKRNTQLSHPFALESAILEAITRVADIQQLLSHPTLCSCGTAGGTVTCAESSRTVGNKRRQFHMVFTIGVS